MLNVLVAEEDVEESKKYCLYLSSNKKLKLQSVNSGSNALYTYLKIKPHILILDSHFHDINSIEIIDRLSITHNEKKLSNILLTTNSDQEQSTFLNVAKIYKIFKKPVELQNLLDTVNEMDKENKYDDFDEKEMNLLLLKLGFYMHSPCTQLMKEAIIECYHSPNLIWDLKSLYKILSYHHKDASTEAIRSSLRTCLLPFNKNRDYLQNHLFVEQFKHDVNISPSRFLDVFVSYLHNHKKQEIF